MRANTTIRSVAIAAGFAALSVPAFAADVVYEEPPAPAPIISTPVSTWAGPYGGLSFGYGFGQTDTDGPAGEIDTRGFLVNGFAGWNGQSNSFVYGAEADLGYNFMHDRDSDYGSQFGWEGSLRARLGYAATDNVLLYTTAGLAVGRGKFIDASGSDSNTHIGWTAGAGVDTKLSEQVFGRLEYRYTDYNTKEYDTGSGPQDIDSSHHRIGVGLGIKF